jgi:hypothetical protein
MRSEEMARRAVDAVISATDLVGWNAGRQRGSAQGKAGQYVHADYEALEAAVASIRRASLEIVYVGIRSHLDRAGDVLLSGSAAGGFGAPHIAQIGWAVERTTEGLVGAYLRGDPISEPAPEEFARPMRVVQRRLPRRRRVVGGG